MSQAIDVFISYASTDRSRAKLVALALQARGWAVWWDRKIPPGGLFDDAIAHALDTARCVIVLWSNASVASDWVKKEALEGAGRGILVPALLDDVDIPLGFRRIQAASLVDWRPGTRHAEFDQFTDSVAVTLRSGRTPSAEQARVASVPGTRGAARPPMLDDGAPSHGKPRRHRAAALIVLLVFLGGGIAMAASPRSFCREEGTCRGVGIGASILGLVGAGWLVKGKKRARR